MNETTADFNRPGFLFSNGSCRRALGAYWRECMDGDDGVREIYDRHYSRYHYADGRKPKLFVGPGQKLVLITENADAIWVWRKFIDASGQRGVNCSVFRNEGPVLSSLLILDAENIAWLKWPGERLYTYVNPRGIKSTNPGACYKHAGWTQCGVTKVNKLLVFEKLWFEHREDPEVCCHGSTRTDQGSIVCNQCGELLAA